MYSFYKSSLSNITSRTLGPLTSNTSPPIARFINGSNLHEPLNSNMNTNIRRQFLNYSNQSKTKNNYKDTSSSEHIRKIKLASVGPNMSNKSTKSTNYNDIRSATKRMRSSGYVVHKKNKIN